MEQRETFQRRLLRVIVNYRHLVLAPLLVQFEVDFVKLKIKIASEFVVLLQIFDLAELFGCELRLLNDSLFDRCRRHSLSARHHLLVY